MLMPGRYTSDTAGHNAWVSQVQLIPYWQGSSLLPVSSTNALYGSTVTTGAGGGYWLNGTYTGLSKTITVVPGAPVKVYITLGYLGTITTLMASETVGSSNSILASRQETQPNTYVLAFTPTTTSVTITMIPQMVWIANTNTLQLTGFSYEQTHYSAHNVLVQLSNKNTDRYEFGYNGQMKANEIAGIGNNLDFMYRAYDSRLGRFKSFDPLAHDYPWNSPYAFAENDVIRAIDLEGAEKYIVTIHTAGNLQIKRNRNKDRCHGCKFEYVTRANGSSRFSNTELYEDDDERAAEVGESDASIAYMSRFKAPATKNHDDHNGNSAISVTTREGVLQQIKLGNLRPSNTLATNYQFNSNALTTTNWEDLNNSRLNQVIQYLNSNPKTLFLVFGSYMKDKESQQPGRRDYDKLAAERAAIIVNTLKGDKRLKNKSQVVNMGVTPNVCVGVYGRYYYAR